MPHIVIAHTPDSDGYSLAPVLRATAHPAGLLYRLSGLFGTGAVFEKRASVSIDHQDIQQDGVGKRLAGDGRVLRTVVSTATLVPSLT